jgi:hypothetical protein
MDRLHLTNRGPLDGSVTGGDRFRADSKRIGQAVVATQ